MKRIFGLMIIVSVYNAGAANQVTVYNGLEVPIDVTYTYENSAKETRTETTTVDTKRKDSRQFSGKKMGKGRPGGTLQRISYSWFDKGYGNKGHGTFDMVTPKNDEDLNVEILGSAQFREFKVDQKLIKRQAPAARSDSPKRARAGSSGDVKRSRDQEMSQQQMLERIATLESELAACKRQLAQ